MLDFSRSESKEDLSGHLDKIREFSSKIQQKISQMTEPHDDNFIESLSLEELKDLRQVILASEYLLTKYKDKKDIKEFLEDFIGIMLNAGNSVNNLNDELQDLVFSAEFALKQIQTLHDEVTQNLVLGKSNQTKIDDFKIPLGKQEIISANPVKTEEKNIEPSAINLTNPTRRIHTNDYLARTVVEI